MRGNDMPGFRFLFHLCLICLFLGCLKVPTWSQEAPTSAPKNQATLPAAPQPSAAQPRYVMHDYTKPAKPFPDVLAPYKPRHVPDPILANAPRMDQLIRDGKMYLSMDDAIALTLENNLDLELARYNLNIADTDILRARAGSNILGVNTGIVQNTPGGGVGGLSGNVGSGTGGTSVAAGGVGSGTNGLVSSTLGIGSPITSFDPVLTSTLQMDRAYALSSSALSGRAVTNNN